jgi:hypothetical protein
MADRLARLARPVLACALLAAPLAVGAEIYRWTDEQGVERFSDRIENVPERFRRDVTAELREERAAAMPDPAPSAPIVPQEPPAEPTPDAAPTPLPEWSARLLAMGAAALLVVALVGISAGLVLMAVAIRIACRVVGEEVPGFGRALAVAAVELVAGIVLGGLLGGLALAGVLDPASPAIQGLQVLLGLGLNAVVIQAMLGQGFGRALVVALVALLITTAVGIAAGLGIALLVGGLVAVGSG